MRLLLENGLFVEQSLHEIASLIISARKDLTTLLRSRKSRDILAANLRLNDVSPKLLSNVKDYSRPPA